jgi:serine/arginine repetitive matrix protein 2
VGSILSSDRHLILNPHDRSIVNGLRDDDEESYWNRTSFVSEHSVRDEGVQVFFREHGRTGSKDSQSSFLSRKSRKATQGEKRPDTKVRRIFKAESIRVPSILLLHQVFFSSSAQIGRLIDNLSQDADAGSFNILHTAHNGTSVQPDPTHWTVEERLEHMLNSLGTSAS